MRFEFDPIKDAANLVKHGVSLALVAELEWDRALVWMDGRKANIREVNHYAAND